MSRITDLPKVELHVHIEGTLEPDLVLELANNAGIELPYAHADELRNRYAFTDLSSFLDIYYDNMAVLRTSRDFARLAYAYASRAHQAGVVHAEVFFDPQAHTIRGIGLNDVITGLVDGFDRAKTEFGITADLIACFLRDRPASEAHETLDALIELDAPIIGVGLDSAEIGNPASKFAEVFTRAAAAGLQRVAHAGEEGGPESIRNALENLGITRIDHGIHSIDDPALMRQLATDSTPLTVCPLSNVQLKTVTSLSAHPLPQLIDAGVTVTINSDDPAYFGGYIDDNFEAVAAEFGLTEPTLAMLAANSVNASFLDADRKAHLLDLIDDWLRHGPAC